MNEIISGYLIKIITLFITGTIITWILCRTGKKFSPNISTDVSTDSFDKIPLHISLIIYIILVAAFGVTGIVSGLLWPTFKGIAFGLIPILILWVGRHIKNTGKNRV